MAMTEFKFKAPHELYEQFQTIVGKGHVSEALRELITGYVNKKSGNDETVERSIIELKKQK